MKRIIKYKHLQKTDPEIAKYNSLEEKKQFWYANFIASENYVSPAVREASSSVLTNKYSEGYPGARYYKGNDVAIDPVEKLAQSRALSLFELDDKKWGVNVQPASGSEANLAVYGALLNPKNHPQADIALGMKLDFGGHLTHGFHVSFSGRFFHFEQYGLNDKCYINYNEVNRLAKRFKPKLIVCGASAYSRIIDFKKFSKIAKRHKALLMADIAHIAGLIAGDAHPSPFPYCDIVTTTTHKTLRGPRGALIFARKDLMTLPTTSPPAPLLRKERGAPPLAKGRLGGSEKSLFQLINSAVFPGLQGGPHDQQTMAIAVALKEAKSAKFKSYTKKVVKNAKALSAELEELGFNIISGGTDNHLILVDLRPFGVSGEEVSEWLYKAGIITNKNAIPNDPLPPRLASGIRLGTPAMTTRGMGGREMKRFARWLYEIIQSPSQKNIRATQKQVQKLCGKFLPPGF